jgi:Flp pilus assembly protein TadB
VARRSSIRASDADRDRIAERLRQAATEGRLLAQELEERLATALRARTYGELDALVADLPRPASPTPRRRGSRSLSVARRHPVLAVAALVAVTMVAFVVAAVVVAGLFAFSGIWVLLALLLLTRRGYRYGPRHRRYYAYRRARYGGRRGRYPHWVP